MRKIGLLGGSFDPPHKGHLYISLEAKKLLKLNEIWWLVTPQMFGCFLQGMGFQEQTSDVRFTLQ